MHPDAKLASVIAAVEEARTSRGMPSGWVWPWGWWVKLWEPGGATHLRFLSPAATYADAACLRDEEMASGRYEKAWMGQRDYQSE